MTLYRYGLLLRPPAPGTVPMYGLVACEEKDGTAPSGHRIYGTLDYKRVLAVKDVVNYDLEYMGKMEVEK